MTKVCLSLWQNITTYMIEKDPILREKELDGYRSIAQKIRNRLQQLENANDKDKRRWVWELLQNAVDAGNKSPIDVIITIAEDCLTFQHNGGYFLPRSVTNLVHQISSKEGTDSIGRFGTGFLTTHTLSRIIEVESIYESNGKFYPFQLVMDRTGITEKDLVFGIEKTWDLYKSSAKEVISVKPKSVNTYFKYIKPNLAIAHETLKDAIDFISYCFAFVPYLNTFTIDNRIENKRIEFKRGNKTPINETFFIETIEQITEGEKKEIQLLCITNKKIWLAIAIEQTAFGTTILSISHNTPRIFCAYPLIGSEDFYFPFVINSLDFSPKTERDKLYLKGETHDAKNNKTLLTESLDLYKIAVEYMSAQGWKDIWRITPNILPPKDDDFDENWYKLFIQERLKSITLNIPIIENEANNLIYIRNCYFPNNEKEALRNKIWEFASELMPLNLPSKKHLHEWYEITKKWDGCKSLTIENLVQQVSAFVTLSNLCLKLQKTERDALIWLNNFILFLEQEEPFVFDKYAILPNQKGVFCLKKNLYEDRDKVEDDLKDILKQLGEDWKNEYLHTAITKADMKNKARSRLNLIQAINGIIDKNDNSRTTIRPKGIGIRKAISQFVAIYHKENDIYRTELYQIVKAFDKSVGNRKLIVTLRDDTWQKADKWLLQAIITDIENCKQISILANTLQISEENALTLLNILFSFLLRNEKLELLSEKKVYPNQEGFFYTKSALFEDINLPKSLKSILKDLEIFTQPNQTHKGWEYLLLDKSITAFKEKHKLNEKTLKDLSIRINEIVRNISTNASTKHRNLILRLLAVGVPNNEKQKTIWEFSRALYGDDSPEKIELLANTTELDVSVCLNWVITRLAIDIESSQFVETLQKELYGNIKALDWLNRVIDFLQSHQEWKHLLDNYAIIPNQNEDLCTLSSLYIDEDIPKILKKVIKEFNYEWIGALLHEDFFIKLPSVRKRTKDDAANEIDFWFRNYHNSKEEPKFVGIWRNLRKYFKEEGDEYLKSHFDWIYRHQAEITLATLGDDEQKDNILQIIESENAKMFNQLAKSLSENQIKELAENPQEYIAFTQWKDNKNNENKTEHLDKNAILKELSQKLGIAIETWEQVEADLLKANRKINFAQLPPPSVQGTSTDWEAIAKSNEEAREKLFEYLGTPNAKALGYDRSAWYQQSNTIITGVKRSGLDIKMVIKGAKTGTVYFDNAKKEQKALLEPFSELWVYDGKNLFEITIGDLIDVWNMVGMKTYMFDFSKSK